ncbi:MAG: NUDIX domain-containing protein [Lachnospiraceae bacterium]
MDHVKRVKRELVYTGSILKFYKDTVETPDGRTAEWDYIGHKGAAAVLPVTEDGKLILVRQYRNALDRLTLEIPAGARNDPEEPTIACAFRELEEETGYKAEKLEFLITLRTAVAFCDELIDVYVATGLTPGEQHLDEDEYVEVEVYTVEQLTAMILDGTIQDAKTVAAIMSYKAKSGK